MLQGALDVQTATLARAVAQGRQPRGSRGAAQGRKLPSQPPKTAPPWHHPSVSHPPPTHPPNTHPPGSPAAGARSWCLGPPASPASAPGSPPLQGRAWGSGWGRGGQGGERVGGRGQGSCMQKPGGGRSQECQAAAGRHMRERSLAGGAGAARKRPRSRRGMAKSTVKNWGGKPMARYTRPAGSRGGVGEGGGGQAVGGWRGQPEAMLWPCMGRLRPRSGTREHPACRGRPSCRHPSHHHHPSRAAPPEKKSTLGYSLRRTK